MIPVYCPLCCDQPFEDQQSLFFHLRGIRNNLYCPVCSERFPTLENLINHLSRKCPGRVFSSEKDHDFPSKDKSITMAITPSLSISSYIQSVKELEQISTDSFPLSAALKKKTSIADPSKNSEIEKNPDIPLIPPELQKKLSKNVSVEILVKKPKESKTLTEKSLNTLLDKESVTSNHKRLVIETTGSHGKVVASLDPITLKISEQHKESSQGDKLNSKNSTINITKILGSEKCKQSEICPTKSKTKGEYTITSLTKPTSIINNNAAEYPSQKITNDNRSPIRNSLAVERVLNKSPQDEQLNTSKPENSLPKNTIKSSSCLKDTDSPLVNSTPLISDSLLQDVPQRRKRGRPRKCPLTIPKKDLGSAHVLPDGLNKVSLSPHKVTKDQDQTPPTHGLPARCNKSLNIKTEEEDDSHFDLPDFEDETESQDTSSEKLILPEPLSKTRSFTSTQDCQSSSMLSNGEVETHSGEKSCDVETELKVEEEFNCSACNKQFPSIYEHIRQFHNGEEVVVELPESEITEDLKMFQAASENKIAIEIHSTPSSGNCTEVELHENDSKTKEHTMVNTKYGPSGIGDFLKGFRFYKPVNSLKKPLDGKWMQFKGTVEYFQFISDHLKLQRIVTEIKTNIALHSKFKVPIKELFENPKVNVVEITYKQNSPFFTHRTVDFKKPIPMYVVERQLHEPDDILGKIASYVIANPVDNNQVCVPEGSKVIAVMKVILASDRLLTLENIVFKEKPANDYMIPILENVNEPEIPLLNGAMMLKWKCTKCLTTTWKFPLTKNMHLCNACSICHKPFVSNHSLRKHMVLHRKDNSRYCEECHAAFSNKGLLNSHKEVHENYTLCHLCKLFVLKNQVEEHKELHKKSPKEQFPCSVCQKVFASSNQVRTHETKLYSRLVAKYNCSLCDKKFFSLTAHAYHTKKHENITIKFPCRFCSKTFTMEKEQCSRKAGKRTPSGYMKKIWHERIHTRDRPYLCMGCPKRFRNLDYQTSHELVAHCKSTKFRNVPIHMCNICDKLFQNESQLRAHKLQHSLGPHELT